jgi:hypothetical protein
MSRILSTLNGLGLEEVNIHHKRRIAIGKALTPTRSEKLGEGLDFLAGNAHNSLRMEHDCDGSSSLRRRLGLPVIHHICPS